MHDLDLDWWVRNAQAPDIRAILDLWQASEADPSLTDTGPDLLRAIGTCGDLFLVAEAEGVGLIGTLIAGWDGWRGNLYRLAVLPRYRRLGVARGLVAEAEARLQACGCRRITALVERDHAWAVAFWQAVGYSEDGRMARWVKTV